MFMPWHLTLLSVVFFIGVIVYVRWKELEIEWAARIEHKHVARLGFEGDHLSTNLPPLETLAGAPATLEWLEFEPTRAKRARVDTLILTVKTPRLPLEISMERPRSSSEWALGAGGMVEGFRIVAEDDSERLTWLFTGLVDALDLAIGGANGWTRVVFSQGVWRFERELGERGEGEAKKRAGELIGRAERVIAVLPERVIQARTLERRVFDADEPFEVHWRAARALALEHANTGNARRVFKALDSAPHAAQMAFAVWGADGLFDDEARVKLLWCALDSGVRALEKHAIDMLARHDPVAMLSDTSISGRARFDAVPLALEGDAYRRDPGAFDAPLVSLILDERHLLRGELERYAALREMGWILRPDALLDLARRGSDALLDELTPQVRALEEKSRGQLTLSAEPDGSRGALSPAEGVRGALTDTSGEG